MPVFGVRHGTPNTRESLEGRGIAKMTDPDETGFRCAWLIDVGYVVKASDGRFKLDYVAARRLLEGRFGRTRAFLFNGFDPQYGIPPGLQSFYDAMRRQGMEIRLHPMESGPPGENRQRRVDVDFSAHMIWQASLPEIEAIVITTGDQDFVPAVELAKAEFGKTVVLFTYESFVHHDLAAAVDDWMLFETYKDQVVKRS
ncbi:MAG: hypothetical protein Kow0047_27660 [Anaerolineae bacterium]